MKLICKMVIFSHPEKNEGSKSPDSKGYGNRISLTPFNQLIFFAACSRKFDVRGALIKFHKKYAFSITPKGKGFNLWGWETIVLEFNALLFCTTGRLCCKVHYLSFLYKASIFQFKNSVALHDVCCPPWFDSIHQLFYLSTIYMTDYALHRFL